MQVGGESDRFIEISTNLKLKFEYESEHAYTQSSLIHVFILLSRNEIFVFTWIFFSSYLSASQPQLVTQGSDELQETVVVTTCLHMFFLMRSAF